MLKQNFADQLKSQSEIWNAQVKDYQGRVEQAGEQARGEYKIEYGANARQGRASKEPCRESSWCQRGGMEGHGRGKPEGFRRTSEGLGRRSFAFPVRDATSQREGGAWRLK
jgi:hypothetical protein